VARLVLFNKPFRVLSQFRASGDKETLASHIQDPDLRVAGRLDYDSEGLLLLTNDGALAQRITHPRSKMPKTYWAQVEGIPEDETLDVLRRGVTLKDGPARPAQVSRLPEPRELWPRDPPIRHRVSVPDCWLEITIREGRNRQVRRMTAAVGHPTLRLVRVRVGAWRLDGLAPGEQREITV
jgi:23S rRNA pseudouridine2457 synthase